MSNDKNITIVAPEGFEPVYHDDGTVTFRPAEKRPEEVDLWVDWSVSENVVYEYWNGVEWVPDSRRSVAVDPRLPTYRNPRFERRVVVRLRHPDEGWVAMAADLLSGYVSGELQEVLREEMRDDNR